MKSIVVLFVCLASSLCAQEVDPLGSATKDADRKVVVATINGRPVTAGEMDGILASFSDKARVMAMASPSAFLARLAWQDYILRTAEKNGIPNQQPYKDQITNVRAQTLFDAQREHFRANYKVTPEMVTSHYEQFPDLYQERRVKLIFVPYGPLSVKPGGGVQRTEAEARARAEEAVKKARAGATFTNLVFEYSEQTPTIEQAGDLGFGVRRTTTRILESMRNLIMGMKTGEISDPFPTESGYAVFKVEGVYQATLESVTPDIIRDLKQVGLAKWMDETKSVSKATIESLDFFTWYFNK
jgi:hypothetical protein